MKNHYIKYIMKKYIDKSKEEIIINILFNNINLIWNKNNNISSSFNKLVLSKALIFLLFLKNFIWFIVSNNDNKNIKKKIIEKIKFIIFIIYYIF